ncbi:hypothetical protein IC608_09125 [Devosia sp. PTR5]|uniref:Uncharacterized protein n=1 Tax=Devosia oryzisoli TaxID=2774138 RepID=A0A927FUK0_9HYPH|nr:hypothetical protein [Devosia oryzisoli]MBD8065637.1 hypothetical protein [Devosia oryzisoli]
MTSSAERQRRHRQRQRQGKRVMTVEVDVAHVEAVLSEAGHLPPAGTDDPETLRRALERAIDGWQVVKV